jgi:alpha-beta hydrolase superfamily lysophospholipase
LSFLATGAQLAARLDLPTEPRSFALFAHCFTCGKDIFAASRIAGGLLAHDIAVLRFDFTGIGSSEGEFANTNFSSNVGDLVAAADYLRRNHRAPTLLIGHSLGEAAVLAAAPHIPDATAVATIGAPASAAHVAHNFAANLSDIVEKGTAQVTLAGRTFTITKQFLEDLAEQNFLGEPERMKRFFWYVMRRKMKLLALKMRAQSLPPLDIPRASSRSIQRIISCGRGQMVSTLLT